MSREHLLVKCVSSEIFAINFKNSPSYVHVTAKENEKSKVCQPGADISDMNIVFL